MKQINCEIIVKIAMKNILTRIKNRTREHAVSYKKFPDILYVENMPLNKKVDRAKDVILEIYGREDFRT